MSTITIEANKRLEKFPPLSRNTPFIGGSSERARHTHPQGSRFFHFDIQNVQNVTALGGHPQEVDAPLREILDPPLRSSIPMGFRNRHFVTFSSHQSVIICVYSMCASRGWGSQWQDEEAEVEGPDDLRGWVGCCHIHGNTNVCSTLI